VTETLELVPRQWKVIQHTCHERSRSVRDDRPFGGPNPPVAACFYSPDRGGIHSEAHFGSYAGLMQADAYAGFNRLYEPTSRARAQATVVHGEELALEAGHAGLPKVAQDLDVLGGVFVAVTEIVILRHRPICECSGRCQPVITLRPNRPFEIESMVEHRRAATAGGTARVGTVANGLIRDVTAARPAISVKDARL
jgi:hypothetical protein